MRDSVRKPLPRPAHAPSRRVQGGAPAAHALVRPGGSGGATIHRRADAGGEGAPDAGGAVPAAGGRPLDPATRAYFEAAYGHDLSAVRLHTGAAADASARARAAVAYTLGRDVVFRAGAYDPASAVGRALLAHELAHAVQQSAAGGSGPAPANPAAAAALDALLELRARGPLPPDGRSGKRLRKLFFGNPELQPAADARVRADTAALRANARDAVRAWLALYERAAYEQAVVEWTESQPYRPKGGAPAEPPEHAEQRAAWKDAAAARLKATRELAKDSLSAARDALEAVMAASDPLRISQDDLLDELSDEIEDQQMSARRMRLRSWEIVGPLQYAPTRSAQKEHERRQAKVEKADERLKEAREAESRFSQAREGESAKARRTRERSLRRARTRRVKAETARGDAGRRMTSGGAGSDAMRQFYAAAEVDPAAAEAALEPYRADRAERLGTSFPTASVKGAGADALLGEKDRWWIYFHALTNLENGVKGFDQADTVNLVLKHRWKVAADVAASGLDVAQLQVGTYHDHGLGQYDVATSPRTPIAPVTPELVDLSLVFGRGPDGARRLFAPEGPSRYHDVDRVDPTRAEADVLSKLAYGYFGRTWKRDAIDAFLGEKEGEGAKARKRSPDATRVIAGLWFRGNVFGGKIDQQEVQPRIDAARKALESAARAEVKALGHALRPGEPLFRELDLETTKKGFGGTSPVNLSAFVAPMEPKEARKVVRTAVTRVVAREGGASERIQELIAHLWPKYGGDRSGPAVQVIHRFREEGGSRQAWIVVSYRHLYSVGAVRKGAETDRDTPLGQLGSTGNAVSPHIHMSIAVFDRDPGAAGEQIPLGYLSPLDFFPMMRRARTLRP